MPILAPVQNYAWGVKGDSSLVAKLHARNAMDSADASKPYAELWIGTHSSAPAKLYREPGKTLTEYIAEEQKNFQIGEHTLTELPYLLKVLSVGGALSIQAHPNKVLAAKLHEKNPTAYKDDNYKPEMAVALTPFDALCGFRSCDAIMSDVTRVPEFAEAAGRVVAEEFVMSIRGGAKNRADALKSFFGSLMRQEEEKVKECLTQLVERLNKMEEKDIDAQDKTLQELHAQYPGDVGCFAAYLMNRLTLKPGEAIYIGANEPHAYLGGECVEIMANSDNVVRAGLTPKFKDVDVLVDMLTYKDDEPEVSSCSHAVVSAHPAGGRRKRTCTSLAPSSRPSLTPAPLCCGFFPRWIGCFFVRPPPHSASFRVTDHVR